LPVSDDNEKFPQGAALRHFIASMTIDYEKWHDGIGYDLSTIDRMTANELESATKILLERQPPTWRDLEALDRINSPMARQAIADALKHSSAEVRVAAARYTRGADSERQAALIDALQQCDIYDGLTPALDQVEHFHPPAIIDTLLRLILVREGPIVVHFAAMLFFIFGKAKSSFDWDHRPYFLKFDTEDRAERVTLFKELCKTIGVDAEKYL
jgi:hypothetical protein